MYSIEKLPLCFRARVGKLHSMGLIKFLFKGLEKTNKEYVAETICALKSLKHLLFGFLWKTFPNPCFIVSSR